MQLNWALIIAVLAFGLSVFNAYWTHFRIKRAFYFLRVANLTRLSGFALLKTLTH